MDVAGTAFADRGNEYWAYGGTGSPARTLISYIESKADGVGPRAASRKASRKSSAKR
jgi:hypothetical protein